MLIKHQTYSACNINIYKQNISLAGTVFNFNYV